MRVFTWHVHGNYLWYLAQARCDFYLPVKPGRPHGYGGRTGAFPWPANVHEVPVERVPELALDCILFQARQHWEEDQYRVLSERQRRLPRLYLEHDPPRAHPTDTRHPVDDPDVLLIHVTHFNALMWDSGRTPARVIEHGVLVPEGVRYTGEIPRGLVVVNHLRTRGRRLGLDVFLRVREAVPLDLVGMDSESLGGLGEVPPPELPAFAARYRFFFHPARYTSLGLAVCEAMHIGMPIVGLATTELVTVVENNVSGFLDTNLDRLIAAMHRLITDYGLARRLGEGARRAAARFDIRRFAREWEDVFALAVRRAHPGSTAGEDAAGTRPAERGYPVVPRMN